MTGSREMNVPNGRVWRNRGLPALAALALLVQAPGAGPFGPVLLAASIQGSCADDYAKYCKPPRPDSPVEVSCLRQYWTSLSPKCRKAVGPSKKTTDDSEE